MPSDNRERRSKHGYEQIQEQPHFNAESNQKRDVPTYPALTFKTFLWHTLPLILCNLLCEGLFALTLKLYGEKRVLERPNRIWFNTILLSLAAAISTGVGFLLDQIGYMLRGILLMRGGNTKREVGHILRGTIGSYILLVWVHLRRSSCSVVTTLVWFFVVVNVLGRLSVGFFGVTYTLDYEDIVTDKGLALTVWPTPGDVEFKVDDYFEAKGLSNGEFLVVFGSIWSCYRVSGALHPFYMLLYQ
ncbi:hypothetical protein BDZ91DRAFT_461730 [Kalaharituber pfeilii]|nr:hypothetical protein BDZ91DRAFT_461730 [Kalaharituber pfeilii]